MNKAKLLAWHSWLGLFAGIILILLSVSGSLLVFHHELDELTYPDVLNIQEPADVISVDKGIEKVQERYPDRALRVYADELSTTKAVAFDVRSQEEKRMVYTHPKTGEVLLDVDRDRILSRWLIKFHYSLFAGAAGNWLIAFTGFLFFGSLLTGTILYKKHILNVLMFRVKFKRKNKRTIYSSLHRIVGVWSLLFNLIIVVTGLFLEINIIIHNLKAQKNEVPVQMPKVQASVDAMLHKLETEYPDFNLAFLKLPTKQGASVVFYGKGADELFLFAPYSSTISINTTSGVVEEVNFISNRETEEKLLGVVTPLHFGDFAGYFSKILYSILGLVPGLLSVSGFYLWYKRKNEPVSKAVA